MAQAPHYDPGSHGSGLDDYQDYREHERTYARFLRFVRWAVIGTAIVLILLYFIINP